MKSTFIVGTLLIAYVFFVAAKGDLGSYLSVFYGPTTQGPPITGPSGASTSTLGSSLSGLGLPAGGTDTASVPLAAGEAPLSVDAPIQDISTGADFSG